ncbi:unnamed protein product [Acanthosepion pharaonis]|uniref:Heme-binding protein 2 n=1 Tax=Acanthosepion pharaonis TaxID=158019 RepID=A0A812CSJ9_ACAPH|nr:unnamed protein product [Sepia pharaonis]
MPSTGKIMGSVLLLGLVICLLAVSVRGNPDQGLKKEKYAKGKYSKIFEEITGAPEFCHKRACPKYTPEYELRYYEESKWLSINKSANANDTRSLFMTLFRYITGNNSENQTIAMTVPVLKKILPNENMVLSFYITQPNAPKPNDPRLYFETFPAQNVYGRVFGGFAKKKDNEENKQKLIDAVGASKVESNFYFVASYDAPWVQNDRHNEIWLLAKN